MNGSPLLYRLSPAGVLDVSGSDRTEFLQGLTTNDFRTLAPGGALWSAALSPTGKVLFSFRAASRGDRIRILLAAGRVERAASHFGKYAVFRDVRVEPPSPSFVRFDFYGPESPAPRAEAEVWPPFFEHRATWVVAEGDAGGVEAALLAGGFRPIAEEEAEARRIEAGRPADGREVDETRTADEAGLAGAVSTAKGCYVGQEVVARMRTYGRLPRRLVRFRFPGAPAREGERLARIGEPDREAGIVTSSARSARWGPVGLGYAGRDVEDGETLTVLGRKDAERAGEPILARVEPVEPSSERAVPAAGGPSKIA